MRSDQVSDVNNQLSHVSIFFKNLLAQIKDSSSKVMFGNIDNRLART